MPIASCVAVCVWEREIYGLIWIFVRVFIGFYFGDAGISCQNSKICF